VSSDKPIIICTRGSALALAQSRRVLADCEALFPHRSFELKIIKTTGDKLQTAALANPNESLPKGLFTKELEVALLEKEADIAVHSLKDLPTELPEGLKLSAVGPRADVRDVLVFRDAAHPLNQARLNAPKEWSPGARDPYFGKPRASLAKLPPGAVVATSSTRRAAQVLALRPDLQVVPIRGNVGTRLQKVMDQLEIDATILAAAGLLRLNFDLGPRGELRVDPRLTPAERAEIAAPPAGLLATILEPEEMLPAVGQGAVALETRADDPEIDGLCAVLNHLNTFQAVTAERAFLRAMGGGCQSPVAGYARVLGHQLHLRAVSFREGAGKSAEGKLPVREAARLGEEIAAQLK
jgi:hydroxymethylbilane synthase